VKSDPLSAEVASACSPPVTVLSKITSRGGAGAGAGAGAGGWDGNGNQNNGNGGNNNGNTARRAKVSMGGAPLVAGLARRGVAGGAATINSRQAAGPSGGGVGGGGCHYGNGHGRMLGAVPEGERKRGHSSNEMLEYGNDRGGDGRSGSQNNINNNNVNLTPSSSVSSDLSLSATGGGGLGHPANIIPPNEDLLNNGYSTHHPFTAASSAEAQHGSPSPLPLHPQSSSSSSSSSGAGAGHASEHVSGGGCNPAPPFQQQQQQQQQQPPAVAALASVLQWVDASLRVMQETRWQAVGYEPGPDGVSADLAKPLHVLRNPNTLLNAQLAAYTLNVQGALEVLVSSVEQQQTSQQESQQQLLRQEQTQEQVSSSLEPLTTAAASALPETGSDGSGGSAAASKATVAEGSVGEARGSGSSSKGGAGENGIGAMPRLARAGSSAGADIDALLSAAIGNGDMTADGTMLPWPGGLLRGLSSTLARGMSSDAATAATAQATDV